MTVLKDILSIATEIGDKIKSNPINSSKKTFNVLNKKPMSISQMSSDSILQFPCLVDTSISLEDATMVTKALEREYVSFIAILTSTNSITDAKTIKDYLNTFHNNANDAKLYKNFTECTLLENYNPFNNLPITNIRKKDEMIIESISYNNLFINGEKSNIIKDNEVIVNYNDLSNELKQNVNEALEQMFEGQNVKLVAFPKEKGIYGLVNKNDLNEEKHIFILKNFEDNTVRLLETVYFFDKPDTISESVNGQFIRNNKKLLSEYNEFGSNNSLNSLSGNIENYSIIGEGFVKDTYDNKFKNKKQNTNSDISSAFTNTGDEYVNYERVSRGRGAYVQDPNTGEIRKVNPNAKDNNGNPINELDIYPNYIRKGTKYTKLDINGHDISTAPKLVNNDIKKANELIPTLLNVNTYFRNKNGELQAINYLIGIKCVMHSISSDSMVKNLAQVSKNGKGFFNLMKATTGETSFIKDFVFALDRIEDEIKSSKNDNKWWFTLKNKKRKGLINSKIKGQNLPPNASLIVSMDTIEKVRIDYGIDLTKIGNIKKVVSDLCLLGFVIVDASVEIVYVYFDSRAQIEQYSFSAMERENSNAKREIANIVQMMGRM